MLKVVKEALQPAAESLIMPVSPVTLRKRWDRLLKLAKLDGELSVDQQVVDRRLTPGSLRPGGATADYLALCNLSRL